MIIYKATNIINGKLYIGQTIYSLRQRVCNHVSNAMNVRDKIYFHRAIRKDGPENFKWEIIAESDSPEELDKLELFFILKYNTFVDGYNRTKGGKGKPGYKYSDEVKKRMSKINSGKNNPNYGKHHTEAAKEKISKANKGRLVGKKHPLAKKYIIITPKGKKIFIYGLNEFCRNYKVKKLDSTNLTRVAQGKLKQHKGYKCEYWKGEKNGR